MKCPQCSNQSLHRVASAGVFVCVLCQGIWIPGKVAKAQAELPGHDATVNFGSLFDPIIKKHRLNETDPEPGSNDSSDSGH
jgi:ribosomal protein L37AE/L43A